MKQEKMTIFTIGHSTRPFPEFVEMLRSFEIEMVVDVRSFPGSRKFPQYNKETLENSLPAESIDYLHIRELGGRRKKSADSVNTSWRHPAFRSYADYMETDDFRKGIRELKRIAAIHRVAYMCSEAVWWRCHRSMISDFLKVQDWTVLHIMAIGKCEEHPYTSPAKVKDGKLFYGPGENEE